MWLWLNIKSGLSYYKHYDCFAGAYKKAQSLGIQAVVHNHQVVHAESLLCKAAFWGSRHY
jgi:hypothetical protein